MIGFGFVYNWLRKWREILQPIATHGDAEAGK